MSDRYVRIPKDDFNDIWAHDDEGKPVERIVEGGPRIVDELNRLERLVDNAVNLARMEERQHVINAVFLEDLHPEELEETAPLAFGSAFILVRRDYWNRLVRAMKAIWATTNRGASHCACGLRNDEPGHGTPKCTPTLHCRGCQCPSETKPDPRVPAEKTP